MTLRRPAALLALGFLVLAVSAVPAAAQNLVTNGDFEGSWTLITVPAGTYVGEGWNAWSVPLPPTQWSVSGDPSFWKRPDNSTAEPSPGNNFQMIIGGAIKNSSMRGGIYQIVNTSPGTAYDFDLTAAFLDTRGNPSVIGEAHFGYDLTGQTSDGTASSIVWQPIGNLDAWSKHHVRFNATGSQTSIWFRAQVPEATATLTLEIDNVSVTPATQSLINFVESTVQPLVRVIMIDPTTFRLEWTTDVAADSTVEYDTVVPGKGTPAGVINYAHSASESALVTEHSVVISGLEPGETYNYRVISSAPGHKTLYSANRRFETPPPANPAFMNGSFEIAADGDPNQPAYWTPFGRIDGRHGPFPAGQPSAGYFGIIASEGEYFIASVGHYDNKSGGYYQRIQAESGKTYSAYMDYRQSQSGADPSIEPLVSLIGIDPYGGIDPESPNIIWGQGVDLVPTAGPMEPYSEASVEAQAQADSITIFVRIWQKFPIMWNRSAIDNVRVEFPEYEASSIGDARSQPDGTNIFFEDGTQMVVTLVPVVDTGFFYMQDADGTAGIRVNYGGAPPAVGDTVSVSGKLETAANGEKVLTNSSVTVNGTGITPVWHIANKHVGGAGYAGANAGLSNEGLLVMVWGEVKSVDFFEGSFIIDDGSAVDAGAEGVGIKVTNTNMFPMEGQYVGVIGVVTSEISDGKKIRVIRGREATIPTDFVTFN